MSNKVKATITTICILVVLLVPSFIAYVVSGFDKTIIGTTILITIVIIGCISLLWYMSYIFWESQ